MANYSITSVARRVVYSGSAGVGPYSFSFPILAQTDIQVYIDSTIKSLTTDYTVSLNTSNGTGSVSFTTNPTTPTSSNTIILVGGKTIERTTDFVTAGDLLASSLNTELDALTIFIQQLSENNDRSIKGPITDSTSLSMELPTATSRANKVLSFSSTGVPETTVAITDVSTVAGLSSEITTLSGISSAISGVNAVASNVSTVAGISSAVSSVASKASLITSDFVSDLNTLAVTDVINDINTLATSDIVSDLNTLATTDIVSDLNTLATSDIVSDVNTLATSDIVSDLNTLATSDFVSDLNTIATTTNVNNIGTVAGNQTNLNTVAGISSNVSTVAGISSNVTSVAGIASNVTTVAGNNSNISTLAGINSNVTTLAGISSDVTTLANSLSSTTNYAVTVASGTLYGGGSGNVFYLDGTGNPAITLIRGNTYIFDQSNSSNSGHPIAFKTSADASYTTGVTSTGTPGSSGAKTTFVVASDAPASLKYYCTAHGNGMGNLITVNTSNINVVASNIGSVNDFAQRYRVASSDPTSSLDEGDLAYNSTANVLKYYNGSAWVTIVAGSLTDVVQDGSPQLGADLDVQTHSIVSTSNRDIAITPNGSGKVVLDGLSYPVSDGTADQAITTDGSGNLTFSTIQASEISTVGNVFSNYNSIGSNCSTTTASTKNAILYGQISVTSSATWTIGGNGTLQIL